MEISERRKMEDALTRSNRELQQFAFVASHDLQEPLRMVASFVQLLGERYQGKLDAKADQWIGFAVDGAKRMQVLINDLLAYSRVETKGMPLEPTDSETALTKALNNLQITIAESNAQVTHDPLPKVMADSSQMVQLFQNLIGNAVKFRGDERPYIHIAAERDGDNQVFSVRDNGLGIDPRHKDRIFVMFQRLHQQGRYSG